MGMDEGTQGLQGAGDEELAVEEEAIDLPAIYYPLQPKFQTNYRVDGRQRRSGHSPAGPGSYPAKSLAMRMICS